MIWADAKNFYNTHIGEDGHKDENVIDMWKKALEKCTPEVWNAKVCHTEKNIKEWYDREVNIDQIPQILISLNGEDSSEDSDSEQENLGGDFMFT